MKILAIDTSATPVSAALTEDSVLLGEFYLHTRTTHSQTLMPVVEALLKTTETKLEDIDVFAVNAGPGSFTGVRIGVASIKGMAMPLQKPCASVSTLAAMAYGMPYQDGIICAVMDARCNQVYHALFLADNGKLERLTEDKAFSIEELADELSYYEENRIYLVGDGAKICYEALSGQLPTMYLPPENIRYQRAYGTAAAAWQMAQNQQLCTADELMPLYLRIPQAERELKARQAAQNDQEPMSENS